MGAKIAPGLLVVLLFLPIHHVIGSCTTSQKDAILDKCKEYTKLPYYPVIAPSYIGVCCDKVRAVPGLDMECIVSLLTQAEKKVHSDKKIKGLRNFCPYHSPPPPHRQMMVQTDSPGVAVSGVQNKRYILYL